MSQLEKTPSIFGGAMIIAGTVIGAGMLALPIATAGMWFSWALAGMAIAWFCMYQSGLCILEANMHYPIGAHTDTIAKDCLSKPTRFINALSLVFVLYILTYAYITVGSPFLIDSFAKINASFILGGKPAAFLYVFLFGSVVAFSTKAVDRLTSVILIAMILTFVLALPNLLHGVKIASLMNEAQKSASYAPYTFAGIASIVAAFGFHGNVSSLVKYYKKDARKVQLALLYGTLLAAVVYTLWVAGVHGNLSREIFRTEILTAPDAVPVMLSKLSTSIPSVATPIGDYTMGPILILFSNFAILSSFLGVSLGLFDWIADFFKLSDNVKGRFITALLTYLPPTILALLFPYGFVRAIGFAGLAATVWALIVPAMMMRASRKKFKNDLIIVKHGPIIFVIIVAFGIIVASSEIAHLLSIIPIYK